MARISAGSDELNRWLHGGYESDIITVIYGPPGSGKTNFCLLAAVSQAKKGGRVIYIDTEGGFSVERVKQIAGKDADEALKHILLLKPTNFDEQKEAFEQLLKYVKRGIALVVVDGMTILYRLDAARARHDVPDALQSVNTAFIKQLRMLAEIARKQGLPVLVTSQTYVWEKEVRVVGGDMLRYWGKCLIELVQERSRRTAYLRKHRSLPESALDFQIVHEGITKRGWL